MTRRVQSLFRDTGASTAAKLVGALGGPAAVPFYYNLSYNLNFTPPAPGPFIQWGDVLRGYQAPPGVIQVNQFFGQATAGNASGLSSPGNNVFTCGSVTSANFRPPAGSIANGITSPGAQCIWMVGAAAAGQTSGGLWRLTSQDNTDVIELGISSGGFYQVSYGPGNAPAVSSIAADGTVRLILVTLVTGNNHGIQVPTHGALVQSSISEPTRTTQPYSLALFPGDVGGGINSVIGNVIEIGGLTRSPTSADQTLLQTNAVTYGATL